MVLFKFCWEGIGLTSEKVLVVDDEKDIVELIKDFLENEGFEVITAYDGKEALKRFEEFKPQLAILDVMLPEIDGMEVCRKIRERSSIPILMVSAKRSDVDKILGLGLGADDYITKPFSPSELMARVRAQFRRYNTLSSTVTTSNNLRFGRLEIDLKSYTVYILGQLIPFSGKEFELLKFFATNPSQVFTREQIYSHVWGYTDFADINTVTVHIKKIREKIEVDPANSIYIKTVWGIGYKFVGG